LPETPVKIPVNGLASVTFKGEAERRVSGDRQQELVVLLARVAAGDRAAFSNLYARTSGKLFASILRILDNRAAAEDAVQEAYLRIWNRAGDFDSAMGSPIAWMTTIARHAAIDTLRRGSEKISAASSELAPELVEGLADPATDGERLTGGPRLKGCLERLEPDRRGMVLLAYCHGWSREELAQRFDRPVATIKTILRRSLIALKECLGGGD
jgi:RNA polymerase sigma-70 factor (ECF subfamily)